MMKSRPDPSIAVRALKSAAPFARPLFTVGHWVQPLLGDSGAMYVQMEGLGTDGEAHELTWTIVAEIYRPLSARQSHPASNTCGAHWPLP